MGVALMPVIVYQPGRSQTVTQSTRAPIPGSRRRSGYKGPGPAWYELAGLITFPAPRPGSRLRSVRVDLAEDPLLHVGRREGRPHPRPCEIGDADSVETEEVGRDLVLPVERRVEHRRVVGVHGHRHAGVPEGADGVLVERGHGAGGDVSGVILRDRGAEDAD